MLAEILFTPEAFVESCTHNNGEVLREISRSFFPRNAACSALVCKLGDEWERETTKRISLIKDPNQKSRAQAFFLRLIHEYGVLRSISVRAVSEADWIRVGLESSRMLPFESVVVSDSIQVEHGKINRVNDLVADDFWRSFENPRRVDRNKYSQESQLRCLCAHADWMIVRLPYIRGGNDDEIVTAKQMIRLAKSVELRAGAFDFQLQVPLAEKLEDAKKLGQDVYRELAPNPCANTIVTVSILKKRAFVNRELIAGDFARESNGTMKKRARWLLTMSHVAVVRREATRDDSNSWCLYSRGDAAKRFEEIREVVPLYSVTGDLRSGS